MVNKPDKTNNKQYIQTESQIKSNEMHLKHNKVEANHCNGRSLLAAEYLQSPASPLGKSAIPLSVSNIAGRKP